MLTVSQFGGLDAAFSNAGVMARSAPTVDSKCEGVGPRDRDKFVRGVELHKA
jgi:hypothetical protein